MFFIDVNAMKIDAIRSAISDSKPQDPADKGLVDLIGSGKFGDRYELSAFQHPLSVVRASDGLDQGIVDPGAGRSPRRANWRDEQLPTATLLDSEGHTHV